MDIIRWAINKPVSVTVGVILLLMFGLIGLGAIPVQLTPTVDRPVITISTNWPGRSPEEIVDSITREQEKYLKNVPNLKTMRSSSVEGSASITLEFYINADISRALQEVSDALRQVPNYPDEVDEPVIDAAEGAAQSAIAWIIVDLADEGRAKFPDYDITTLFDPLDKEVRPFLERIDGVADVNLYGGREREVRILLDPERLAQRNLNHLDVIDALRRENVNTSAGTIAEGKRDYRIRVIGQFADANDILETIVAYRAGASATAMDSEALKPIYLRDIGTVEFGFTKQRAFVRSLGRPCIAMNCIRQSGANVIQVMDALRSRLDDVRVDILPRLDPQVGPYLQMRQVYDETTYIDSAIALVKENLWQGGLLAALVLLIFLRSFISTGLVALAIPLSVIGAFTVMYLSNRTLNVISLAGLAFSVGMGIDNAIVVLENIFRRRELGDAPIAASYRGAREVWGAILASTLTNVAVFIPIITIQEEAGQLFRDICLAATASVFFSLLVAVTVIPVAASRWLPAIRRDKPRSAIRRAWDNLFGLATLCAVLTGRFSAMLRWVMSGWRAHTVRPMVIAAMTVASLVGGWLLMPPLDYLPPGNQNLAFGFMMIPPGYSLDQQRQVAERIESAVLPYSRVSVMDRAAVEALPPIPRFFPPGAPFDPVPIANCFVVGFSGSMFGGATSQDPDKVLPVATLLSNAMNTSPGAMGFASQASIFGRGVTGASTINLEISGPDIARVIRAASVMQRSAMGKYGFVRADPSNFDLSQPEWRLTLNRHGRELGLTPQAVGVAVRGLFDGAYVDEFSLSATGGGDTIDMVILPTTDRIQFKEQLASIPIAAPGTGGQTRIVPLDSVVDAVEANASQSIQRIEELAGVTLYITPPNNQPLEAIMQDLREGVIAPAEASGLIDQSMRVRLEGSAAKLDQVRAELFGTSDPDRKSNRLQQVLYGASVLIVACGVVLAFLGIVRAFRQSRQDFAYGAVGILLLSILVAALIGGFAWQPQFLTARFIWALLVTYLLMCALYESFVYPFVIMFSVPLAVVGGFAGLRIVHDWTLSDPTKAAQQLDVLTMLGFVILIGIVVNNAILLVEQALNLMQPWRLGDVGAGEKPLAPLDAITESVRTRMRPIFMSTLTSVFGTLPLILYPGAGSEMYRGMGAVLIGGQLVSTAFTLVLVPLAFSLVVQMHAGFRTLRGRTPIDLAPVRESAFTVPATTSHSNGLPAAKANPLQAHQIRS